MLTEVQSGLDGRAGSMATLTGGGAEAELVDRGASAVLRASGLQDSTRSVAGEKNKGSEGSKILRRRAIAREWTHRRGWLRVENPSAAWRKPWSCGPKGGRGALAKLRRG